MKSFLKGLGIFFAVCLAFSLWYVILGVVIIVLILGIILTIRKNRYFASPEFQTHRQRTATLASEYNEVASYVHDIYTHGIYELGTSTNGMYSHLATVEVQQPKTWQTLRRKKTDERPRISINPLNRSFSKLNGIPSAASPSTSTSKPTCKPSKTYSASPTISRASKPQSTTCDAAKRT